MDCGVENFCAEESSQYKDQTGTQKSASEELCNGAAKHHYLWAQGSIFLPKSDHPLEILTNICDDFTITEKVAKVSIKDGFV